MDCCDLCFLLLVPNVHELQLIDAGDESTRHLHPTLGSWVFQIKCTEVVCGQGHGGEQQEKNVGLP